jgi:uncharacterized DUF497 family protein
LKNPEKFTIGVYRYNIQPKVDETVSKSEGFQWDEGNSNKNWHLHRVTDAECEEVFFNLPLIAAPDTKHSNRERRFYALGRTENDRRLFVAFTIRENLIRVVSAREMTRGERKKYAEKIKGYTDF